MMLVPGCYLLVGMAGTKQNPLAPFLSRELKSDRGSICGKSAGQTDGGITGHIER
jgi:hypothetical protein